MFMVFPMGFQMMPQKAACTPVGKVQAAFLALN